MGIDLFTPQFRELQRQAQSGPSISQKEEVESEETITPIPDAHVSEDFRRRARERLLKPQGERI